VNALMARVNRRILGKDAVDVASVLDDFVLILALRGDKLEPRALDGGLLDAHVAEVVVGDQNRALGFGILLRFHGVVRPLSSPHPARVSVAIRTRAAISALLGRTRMLQDGGRGDPCEPAGYSWSGTNSFDQASSTGVTARQGSSASSARIDRAEFLVGMPRSSCA
jgi:hypothetical protein